MENQDWWKNFTPLNSKDIELVLDFIRRDLKESSLYSQEWENFTEKVGLYGWSIVLSLPEWACEITGTALAIEQGKILQIAQFYIAAYLKILDDFLDQDMSGISRFNKNHIHLLMPFLNYAHRYMSMIFPAASPFWMDYKKLLSQQAYATEWDIFCRYNLPNEFQDEIAITLGHKAAILRWPALAIAHLTGKLDSISRLDEVFDCFFRILQMLDDIADYEQDSLLNQVNAVLIAAGNPSQKDKKNFQDCVLSGRIKIAEYVSKESKWLMEKTILYPGRFHRLCHYLVECAEKITIQGQKIIAYNNIVNICDEILKISI